MIGKVDRPIPHIPIQINIPKPNWIFRDEPLQRGMIIPRAIIVQSRAIILATGVLERIGGRCAGRCGLAKRLIRVLALHQASTVGECEGGA